MSSVALTIHRGAHRIGGNCVEVNAQGGERLVLNVGRALDAPPEARPLRKRLGTARKPHRSKRPRGWRGRLLDSYR